MEPNLEPRRSNPQGNLDGSRANIPDNRPSQPPRQTGTSVHPSAVTVNHRQPQDYAQATCLFAGAAIMGIGLIGFVVDNFLQMHLNYYHALVHVVAGVAAIACGYLSREAARIYAFAAGAVFGLLGIAGFILGQRAMSTIGSVGEDRALWVIAPQYLEFGAADHIMHLIYAAVFIAGALIVRRREGVTTVVSK